jgi:hypothetical protein
MMNHHGDTENTALERAIRVYNMGLLSVGEGARMAQMP